MKYSYEFKLMCVDMYRQGKWPDTPKGIKDKTFHDKIRVWVRQEDACGEEILRHKSQNKVWSAEEKYELVAQVLAGKSCKGLAISHGINYDNHEIYITKKKTARLICTPNTGHPVLGVFL